MSWFKKIVPEWERIPKGYGIAYYLPPTPLWGNRAVCYPVPINWIPWAINELYLILICPPWIGTQDLRREIARLKKIIRNT